MRTTDIKYNYDQCTMLKLSAIVIAA